MSSVVSEFHDCPSLQHLDELSTEIFDSPRVQVGGFMCVRGWVYSFSILYIVRNL